MQALIITIHVPELSIRTTTEIIYLREHITDTPK